MEYQFNIYNLLIGFGMMQGFIFSGLLIMKSPKNTANRFLGLTVLFLSLYLVWVLKYDYGIQKKYTDLQFLPVLFLWGIGPAFYAYLKAFFGQALSSKQIHWHFFPLLLEMLMFNGCTAVFFIHGRDISSFNTLERFFTFNIFSIEHIIGLLSMAYYLHKCYRLLLSQKESDFSIKIRNLLMCITLLWLVWVPYTIFDIVYYHFGFPPSEFYAFYLFFGGLVYCIGFLGFRLRQPELTNQRPIILSPEMHRLALEIDAIMKKEQLFLQADLDLKKMAIILNQHPNKISAVINKVLGQSFRDYVNSFRLETFKKKLNSEAINERTILSLAYESGFNSKASFNRIFKQKEGISPNEYLVNKVRNRPQNA